MKKLILGAALAALLVSAASAQSWQPSVGSGNIVPPYNYQAQTQNTGHGSYAYQPAPRHKAHARRAVKHH
jgi:opacity protein-like surface antigen